MKYNSKLGKGGIKPIKPLYVFMEMLLSVQFLVVNISKKIILTNGFLN